MNDDLINKIDAILPQTQCQECSYSGCKPYAEAIVNQHESIDRCAPGGTDILLKLAELTHTDPTPYLATVEKNYKAPSVAFIREKVCIGCTKCIQACPVDAILGTGKWMHTVINAECTGCELCVECCPVDCIDMIAISEPTYDPDTARQRYAYRNFRLTRDKKEREDKHLEAKKATQKNRDVMINARKNEINAILERAKAKREQK